MSSNLFIGNPDLLTAFLTALPEGHHNHSIAPYLLDDVTVDWRQQHAIPNGIDVVVDLTIDRSSKERALAALAGKFGAETIFIVNALTMTATEAAARLGGDRTVIGISYIPHNYSQATLLEAAPALGSTSDAVEKAIARLRALTPKEIEIVVDRVGLVSARTLAMIINEGAFALMEGVADPADIDTAMKLGTNYPEGPLRWADQIGPATVLAILDALHDEYNEERYRPCVLLKQLARARQGFYAKG